MTYSSNIQNTSNSYQSNTGSTTATTGPTLNAGTQSNNNTQGLYKGQQINGEVMDLRNDEALVRLQDGRLINAKMEDASTLSIGEKVTFKVLDVTNTNLTLKIISDGATSSLDQILDKALDLAGLSKNSRNKEIVGELLKQQMSIDKNAINLILKQSLAFKGTPISTLVLLNKYQFPVTKENLKLFEDYEKHAHNIYTDLENISGSITDLFQSNDVADEVYLKESKQLLQMLFTDQTNELKSDNTLSMLTLSKESMTELQQLMALPKESLLKEFVQNTGLLNNPSALSAEQVRELLALLKTAGSTNITGELERLLDTHNISQEVTSTDLIENSKNRYTKNLENPPPVLTTDGHENHTIYNKNEYNLIEYLKNNGIPSKDLNNINLKIDLLTYISSHIDSFEVQTAKELLNSKDFKELIKDQLLTKWSITPDEFSNKEKVDNHLESLTKDIKNLSSFLEQTSLSHSSTVGNQATKLMDNLNFMNQLNHFFTYTQIPLKLHTGYTKSELYVYSKRKPTGESNDNVSVLLHLDMNHLGPLDIYLKLAKNQLDSTFYCDSDQVISLVSSQINKLEQILTEKGFHFTTSVQARTKTVHVIKEILDEESTDSFGIRYNFDVRA
ncbi:MAG: flagellar hook-length control protein FliK [Anaerocolumna sp.]